jgi:diguanylate cyclase (GGDEF)-like protein
MNLLTILLQQFEKARDYFLPHELVKNGNIDVAYRFRLLADMIIICMIVIVFFAVYYPFITHFSWPGSIFSTSFSVILLSFHAFLLMRLRQQKNHAKTAQWLIASVFLAIIFGIIITGGVLNSLTPVFLPLPIIMAFLLIDRRTGLIYSAVTFSVYITLTGLSYRGFEFPQTIPLGNTDDVEILLWLFFSISMLALVIAYDGLSTRLIHQLKFEQEKQTYLATHDSLTDLANRQKFDEQLNEAIHRSSRLGNSVTLLIIDLNKFKPINDSFGHDAGDAILVHVAKQIASTIRTDDLAARIGGDEFAVILQGDKTIKDITALMGRLTQQITSPLRYKNKILTVTASIGIASYPDQTKTEEDLRKAADTAMYAAKKKGKDWMFFNESLDNE